MQNNAYNDVKQSSLHMHFANYSTKNIANVEKMTHLFAQFKKKQYLCNRKDF